MAVTLTGATPGILVLATLGDTCVLAATISLAAALAAVVGPAPGAVPASAASVAAAFAGIGTIAPSSASALASALAASRATASSSSSTTTTSTATPLGVGNAGLMPAEGAMEVGQKYEESEREKWNCQPLDYRLHGLFLLMHSLTNLPEKLDVPLH